VPGHRKDATSRYLLQGHLNPRIAKRLSFTTGALLPMSAVFDAAALSTPQLRRPDLSIPYPEKGAERRSGHSRDCDAAAAIQRIAGTGPEYPSVGSAAPGAGTSGIFFSVTTFMTLFLF
jgi:hypothetical protein